MKLLIRTGTLIFYFLLIFVKIAEAQYDFQPYYMHTCNKGLNILLTEEKLSDIKSGLFVTGIRSDTLFIIQYFSYPNEIFLIPIANIKDTSISFCVRSGDDWILDNTGYTTSKLLETDGNTYRILQKMPCPKKKLIIDEDKIQIIDLDKLTYRSRILTYTKSAGVIGVEYLPFDETLCESGMKWFITEGEFYYFLR